MSETLWFKGITSNNKNQITRSCSPLAALCLSVFFSFLSSIKLSHRPYHLTSSPECGVSVRFCESHSLLPKTCLLYIL